MSLVWGPAGPRKLAGPFGGELKTMPQEPERRTETHLGAILLARVALDGHWPAEVAPEPKERERRDHELEREAIQEGRLIPNVRPNFHE